MKLRMLFITAVVLVCAAVSFGAPSQMLFAWYNDGVTPGFFPLTEEGTTDGTGTPIPDGRIIKIMLDVGEDGDMTNDTPPPAGTAFGEWSPIEFPFDGEANFLGAGSFYGPGSTVAISLTNPQQLFYLLVCCDNGDPLYKSARMRTPDGFATFTITCPTYGELEDACWTATPCQTVEPCIPTPNPFDIQTVAGGHGDVDEPAEYWCLDLCVEFGPLDIVIGPLYPSEWPVVQVFEGCSPTSSGCDEICDPATFQYDMLGWQFITDDPVRGFGHWVNTIIPLSDGCVCLCLDEIEPVELQSFDAVAGDNSVTLSWSTASETNTDRFEVTRAALGHDADLVGSVNAGEGTYSFTDNTANNGVTYTYSLVEVDLAGNRTVVASAEATPNANLAVITEYALHQNYPNPFNPTTNIVFDVVEENRVELTVYNAVGQLVAKLADGVYGNGRHTVEFSSDNLTSGLYFYTVKVGNEFSATKKMLLVK